MPVNAESINDVREVSQIHSVVVDFGIFIAKILNDVGSDYSTLIDLPARVSSLMNSKARFDALNISNARIQTILERNYGYADFSVDIADFGAVFTKAPAFRGIVETNISALPASYSVDHKLQWVTASAGVQSAITANCNNILQHYSGI